MYGGCPTFNLTSAWKRDCCWWKQRSSWQACLLSNCLQQSRFKQTRKRCKTCRVREREIYILVVRLGWNFQLSGTAVHRRSSSSSTLSCVVFYTLSIHPRVTGLPSFCTLHYYCVLMLGITE